MKKTLAVVGATTIGLVSASAAAPAAADPIACADLGEQFSADLFPGFDSFQGCLPQYGVGKAEFTIVASEDDPEAEFPDAFVSLENWLDSAITTSTTSDLDVLLPYLGSTPDDVAGPITPVGLIGATPGTRSYIASVVAPVTSYGPAPTGDDYPSDLEALCGQPDGFSYDGAWVVEYGPVDTAFSQSINGEDWTYTITAAPKPNTFFLAFTGGPSEFSLAEWCITDGVTVSVGYGQDDFPAVSFVSPYVLNDFLNLTDLDTLGIFTRAVAAPAALPETGTTSGPLLIGGGVLAALGVGALVWSRVRRRGPSVATEPVEPVGPDDRP